MIRRNDYTMTISHDYEYQVMSNNNFGCFDRVATNFQLTFYNFFTVREKIARFFNYFHLIIVINQEDEIVCII